MKKKDFFAKQIALLLADPGTPVDTLADPLMGGSGLPGSRLNWDLAAAFAESAAGAAARPDLRPVLDEWAGTSPDDAPGNSPYEFLVISALAALGALYAASSPDERSDTLRRLDEASRDARWRVREGAAHGFRAVAFADFVTFQSIVASRLDELSPEEAHAFLAALADPAVCAVPERAAFALEAAAACLGRMRETPREERQSEPWLVLARALSQWLAVVVEAQPDPGFALLSRFAGTADQDLKRILASTLRKARILKRYPERCEEIANLLAWGSE